MHIRLSLAHAAASAEPLWERFLTSAGFGGLMAVIAATIAALIARAQLMHNKEQVQHDRWWETLTWVYDRTVVEKEKKTPLPHRVTFSMLTALNNQTRILGTSKRRNKNLTEVSLQREAIDSVLSMFVAPESPGAGNGVSENFVVTDPLAADLLALLRNDLGELTLTAEVYERMVVSSLTITGESAGLTVTPIPAGKFGNAYVENGDGRRLMIDTLFFGSQRIMNTRRVHDRLHAYARQGEAIPLLIVANQSIGDDDDRRVLTRLAKSVPMHDGLSVDFVKWVDGPIDDVISRMTEILSADRPRSGSSG